MQELGGNNSPHEPQIQNELGTEDVYELIAGPALDQRRRRNTHGDNPAHIDWDNDDPADIEAALAHTDEAEPEGVSHEDKIAAAGLSGKEARMKSAFDKLLASGLTPNEARKQVAEDFRFE